MNIKKLIESIITLLTLQACTKLPCVGQEEYAKTDSFLQLISEKINSKKSPVDIMYKKTEEEEQMLDVTKQSIKAQNFWNCLLMQRIKKFNFTPKQSPKYKQLCNTIKNNLMLDVVSDLVSKNKQLQKSDANIIISQNEIADLSLLDNKGVCDNMTNNITPVLDKYTFLARMITPTNDKTEIKNNRNIIKFLVDNPNIVKALLDDREQQSQYEDFLILFHETATCFERFRFDVNYDLHTFLNAAKTDINTCACSETGTPYDHQYLFECNLVKRIKKETFKPYDNVNPIYLLIRKIFNGRIKKILIQSRLSLIGFPLSLSLIALLLKFVFNQLNIFPRLGSGFFIHIITYLSFRAILTNQVGWKNFKKYKLSWLYNGCWVIYGLSRFLLHLYDIFKSSDVNTEEGFFNAIWDVIKTNLPEFDRDKLLAMAGGLGTFFIFYTLYALTNIFQPITYKKLEFYRKLFFIHIKDNVMKNIRGYVSNMKEFYNIIKKQLPLFALLTPLLSSNNRLFATEYQSNETLSNEQKHMFTLMDKENLSENDMVVFLYLFDQNRSLFQEAIQEQAYISTYLYSAERVLSGKYCIADFIDSQDQYISLQNVRHVMLGEKAVSNDVELGESSANGFRNWIFNGMNATGKTVMMETIVDAVIMAQSIGIAPCQRYKSTIFDIIFTIFGASTDIQNNYSKFMAELKQIDNLIHFCEKHKNKKILIGCDEVCSGTDPESAELFVYNTFVKLMQNPNISLLAATHYQLPRQIETKHPELKCGNYMMKVDKDNDGNLVFRRKLARGFRKQSLAVDITNDMVKDGIISPIFNELIKQRKNTKGGLCC